LGVFIHPQEIRGQLRFLIKAVQILTAHQLFQEYALHIVDARLPRYIELTVSCGVCPSMIFSSGSMYLSLSSESAGVGYR